MSVRNIFQNSALRGLLGALGVDVGDLENHIRQRFDFSSDSDASYSDVDSDFDYSNDSNESDSLPSFMSNLHSFDTPMSIFDITKNNQPSSFTWLPDIKNERQSVHINDKGFLSILKNKYSYNNQFWNLLEISLPPFLNKKYHIINSSELINKKENSDCHYITLSTWFVMFNESLGIDFLHVIKEKHNDYIIAKNDTKNSTKLLEKLQNSIDEIVKSVVISSKGVSMKIITKSDDFCSNSKYFILESCIICQLPWKPVIFHQWLTAALMEILKFEQESLELRHYPVNDSSIPCINELLTLIRSTKERITLGFTILSELIKTYPQIDTKIPEYIFDTIVLPSLPVLKYLIDGNALDTINKIKKFNWYTSKKYNEKSMKFTPYHTYNMLEELSYYYTQIPYNIYMWLSDAMPSPFPVFNHNIENTIKDIEDNSKANTDKHKGHSKPLSNDEKCLLNIVEKNIDLSSQQKIDMTVKIIDEKIISKGKLPGVTLNDVKKIFQTKTSMKYSCEIFDITKTSNVHNAIRAALMYNEAHKLLLDSHSRNSVLFRIIIAQLEIHEQEQLIRLINICGAIFKVTPIISKLTSIPVVKIDKIQKLIEQISKQVGEQNRKLFFNKDFRKKWKLPLNLDEDEPKIYFTTKDEYNSITKSLENRLGRLLYQISQESFNVHEKGGESYPDWHIVQYLLPSLVTGFQAEANKYDIGELQSKILQHYATFLHKLIKYYENKYQSWKTDIKPRKTNILTFKDTSANSNNSNVYLKICGLINLKYRELFRLNCVSHLNATGAYTIFINGFDNIVNVLTDWCFLMTCMELDKDFQNCVFYSTNFSYQLMKIFLEISNDAWSVLKPGDNINKYSKLSDLNLANITVSILVLLFEIAYVLYETDSDVREKVEKAQEGILEISLNINRGVINSENLPQKDLAIIVEENLKSINKLYDVLKEFRKILKSFEKFQCHERLPYLNNSIIKNAINFYITGNLDALDDMLHIFEIKHVKKCRCCSKTENITISCEECIKQNYPDIHYFCSNICKDNFWKSQHMIEHLEFELGVSDFAETK